MTTKKIEFAPKIIPTLAPPLGSFRYRVFRGGRGSGKSFSVAKMLAILGATQKLTILATREFQASIKNSFHAELKNAIRSDEWLSSVYDVGINYLRHRSNGTEFIFAGLRNNIESVKSTAQIDICIVEEAESVPISSWIDLIPTIRAKNSEIWIIYNPKRRDSWVAQEFDNGKLPPRTAIADLNYMDNPWFPEVLEETRRYNLEVMDRALYNHIWHGAYYEQSDAQVFANRYTIKTIEINNKFSHVAGLDFGFSQDPTASILACVSHDMQTLYIYNEFSQVKLELDDTVGALIDQFGEVIKTKTIIADSARPESISYLKRNGLPKIKACTKGKGSIEDGIQFIKSFKNIIIDPKCTKTIKEFDLYSYKTDKLTNEVLTGIIDANNHLIDALRYALDGYIKSRKDIFDVW